MNLLKWFGFHLVLLGRCPKREIGSGVFRGMKDIRKSKELNCNWEVWMYRCPKCGSYFDDYNTYERHCKRGVRIELTWGK